MIRATELAGRAVVDIDAAERLGTIDKLILDPDGRRLAGFVVTRGSGFPGNRDHVIIPASAVHKIGPDAVTVRQSADASTDIARLEALPRGSDLIGRKVVSEDGRFLGKIGDVQIEGESCRIAGYLLSDHTVSDKLRSMTHGEDPKRYKTAYLPADAKLRSGKDLIVTSEEALRYDLDGPDHGVADRETKSM